MVKVYVKGNYLVIEENSQQLWIPKGKVNVSKSVLATGTIYHFHNDINNTPRVFKAESITDEAGAAYADLDTFLTSNTGA